MICGRRGLPTSEQTVNLNPGESSSVTAAPPRTWRRSRTTTFFLARARYAAVTRPLCPPPITMASYRCAIKPDLVRGTSRLRVQPGAAGRAEERERGYIVYPRAAAARRRVLCGGGRRFL